MQNLENLDVFDYTKTGKMPEGPFLRSALTCIPTANLTLCMLGNFQALVVVC